jgi:hypothetical protein
MQPPLTTILQNFQGHPLVNSNSHAPNRKSNHCASFNINFTTPAFTPHHNDLHRMTNPPNLLGDEITKDGTHVRDLCFRRHTGGREHLLTHIVQALHSRRRRHSHEDTSSSSSSLSPPPHLPPNPKTKNTHPTSRLADSHKPKPQPRPPYHHNAPHSPIAPQPSIPCTYNCGLGGSSPWRWRSRSRWPIGARRHSLRWWRRREDKCTMVAQTGRQMQGAGGRCNDGKLWDRGV